MPEATMCECSKKPGQGKGKCPICRGTGYSTRCDRCEGAGMFHNQVCGRCGGYGRMLALAPAKKEGAA